MGAVSVRLRWLLRRHWVATIGFALAAGLASGLSLAAWDAARRTDQVFDRFLAATDSPELDVTFCPPGVTSIEDADVDSLPPVRPAGRARRRPPPAGGGRRSPCRGAHRGDGPRRATPTRRPSRSSSSPRCSTRGWRPPSGDPSWSVGAWPAADAPDEVMVNERLPPPVRRRPGRPPPPAGRSRPARPSRRRSISGAARRSRRGSSASSARSRTSARPTTAARPRSRRPSSPARGSTGGWSTPPRSSRAIRVQARDGDATRARAAIDRAFPDRPVNNQYGTSADDEVPLRDAYHYEAQAALAVAVLTALAALVFVGQALARQVRREWADADVLRSIGLSPRQAALAAAGRGLIIGVRRGAGGRRARHRSVPRGADRPRPPGGARPWPPRRSGGARHRAAGPPAGGRARQRPARLAPGRGPSSAPPGTRPCAGSRRRT